MAGTKCFGVPSALDENGKRLGKLSGVCMCDNFYGIYRRLPSPNTPIRFPKDGYRFNDLCEKNRTMQFIYAAWLLGIIVWNGVLLYDFITTMFRLKKSGALTFNVAGRSLVVCIAHRITDMLLVFTYLSLHLGWDHKYWLHDNVRSGALSFGGIFWLLIHLEVLMAWIDLVQKAATLSRTSSTLLVILQWVLRFFTVASGLIYLIYFILGKDLGLMVILLLFVSQIAIQITGRILRRTLCPDLKDSTHANFKAAEAIRFFYSFMLSWEPVHFIFVLSPLFFNGRDWGGIAFMIQPANFCMTGVMMPIAWISYLKFGNKKILSNYPESPTEKILNLVGYGSYNFDQLETKSSEIPK